MPFKSVSGSARSSNDFRKSLGGTNEPDLAPFDGPDLNPSNTVNLAVPAEQTVSIDPAGSATVTSGTGAIDPTAATTGPLADPLAFGQTIQSGDGTLPFDVGATPTDISLFQFPTTPVASTPTTTATTGTTPGGPILPQTIATDGFGLGVPAAGTALPTGQAPIEAQTGAVGQTATPTATPTTTPITGTIVGQSADGQTVFVQQTPGGPILPVSVGGTPTTPTVDPAPVQTAFPLMPGNVSVSDMIRTGDISNATSQFGPFAAYQPGDANLTTQFTGNATGDNIRGTRDDDLIEGNGGNDRLEGRFGNDYIVGGSGNDRIRGDEGDDRIYGGADNDDIDGNEGDDLIFGEEGDDVLNGDRDDDIVDGGAGDDLILGESGDDAVLGGLGNDRLIGGTGDDLVAGGPGDDFLDDGAGDDVVHGGAGDDTILVGEGNNIVDASDGNDRVTAETGNNIIFGGSDDDMIEARDGVSLVFGGDGNDELAGGMATVVLAGGPGDDVMNAGMGNGLHIGGSGADTFVVGSDIVGNGQADTVLALDFTFGEDRLAVDQAVFDSVTSIQNSMFDVAPLIQPFLDAGLNSDLSFDRMTLVDSSSDFQDDLMFLLDTPADSNGQILGEGVLLANDEGDQIFLLNIWEDELSVGDGGADTVV